MTSTVSSAADMAALSTRERILAEALQLFAESGYGGASMRELARRVGVRESSLYNHFAGKAAILEAIVSAYGPASSASRLEEPRYRQLGRQPAAFCRQFALDLVAQWSDPREHQFRKSSRRNASGARYPGEIRRSVLFARAAPDDGLFPRFCAGRPDRDDRPA
jgi:AcrR family transcriptional regulator